MTSNSMNQDPNHHKSHKNHKKIFLLLHGYQGSKEDLEAFQNILSQKPFQYEVLWESFHGNTIQEWSGKVFEYVKTYFSENIEKWSLEKKQQLSSSEADELPIVEFSILAHSLGGIIARFLLPDLLQYWNSRSHLYTVQWKHFLTIATPHLGVVRPGGNTLGNDYSLNQQEEDASSSESSGPLNSVLSGLFNKNYWNSNAWEWKKTLWKYAIEVFAWSRLGGGIPAQLLLQEEKLSEDIIQNPSQKPILLLQMCYGKYIDALKQFDHRVLVSLAHHDFMVPYPSASIRAYNPYRVHDFQELKFEIVGHSGFEEELIKMHLREIEVDESLLEAEVKHQEMAIKRKQQSTEEGSKASVEIISETESREPLTEENATEKEDSSNADEDHWLSDNFQHLKIHRVMLKQLQQKDLAWKRLDVRFHGDLVSRYTLPHHQMLVSKTMRHNLFLKDERNSLMNECVTKVCDIVAHMDGIDTE